MQVTILGSGTAVPVPGRFPSGVLVEAGDQKILVDIGPGVLRRLAETGVGLEEITAILLTVVHVCFTYAKAATVVDDRRSMLLAAIRGVAFVVAHPFRTFGVYLAPAIVSVVLLVLYGLMAPGGGQTTRVGNCPAQGLQSPFPPGTISRTRCTSTLASQGLATK